MNTSKILVVTGASGSGKTTAVKMLEARGRAGVRCFYFDGIGVPSLEVMHREFGGPERWQAEATKRWIAQLAAGYAGSVSVLDGQTRPSFVRAALAAPWPQMLASFFWTATLLSDKNAWMLEATLSWPPLEWTRGLPTFVDKPTRWTYLSSTRAT